MRRSPTNHATVPFTDRPSDDRPSDDRPSNDGPDLPMIHLCPRNHR